MKRFLFLLACSLTLLFGGCEEHNDTLQFEFAAPKVSNITQTTADVSCLALFPVEEYAGLTTGFLYGPASESVEGYRQVNNPTLSDRFRLSVSLQGLTPATEYQVYAFANLGTIRILSDPSRPFTTLPESGGGDDDGEDDGEDDDPVEVAPTFGTLSHSAVTSSGATLSGSFSYAGSESISKVWFAYKKSGGSEQEASLSTTQGTKTKTLSGLTASTTYTYSLCVTVGGKSYRSATKSFTTEAESSGGGDVTPGKTRYSGWAELPVEVEKSGDYYYAYHRRADKQSVRNYSICYSAKMRCAVWTAYPIHASYDGGAGRNSKWQYDPIIPQSVQPDLSSSYNGSFSRGHMLASSDRQVSVATNQQTFYYTNMAPQYQNEFNGGIWQKLENALWGEEMMGRDTLYVVTGAHFANTNKTTTDDSNQKVVVPTHFYKVLMRPKKGNSGKAIWTLPADQIECVGFWFEHHNSYSTKASPTANDMKSVAYIEQQTGFTFFGNVPQAPKDKYSASAWGF